ncbi:MAG: DUF551 domain-containing protein [Oscillospiraceae bacterium]
MSEWVDVSERLPKDNSGWERYIVTVVSYRNGDPYNPFGDEGYEEVFVLPAIYDSKQKIWHLDWGDYKEELNALITIDDCSISENVVTHWMEYPKPPEIFGTLYRGKDGNSNDNI